MQNENKDTFTIFGNFFRIDSAESDFQIPEFASNNYEISEQTGAILIAEGLYDGEPDLRPIASKFIAGKANKREKLYIYALLMNLLSWKVSRKAEPGIKKQVTDLRILIEVRKCRGKGKTLSESFDLASGSLNLSPETVRKRYNKIPRNFKMLSDLSLYERDADSPYFMDLRKHIPKGPS